MCGIIGIVAKGHVAGRLYDGLTVLQHRGQDSAGMVTCDQSDTLHLVKGNGLVRDVFDEQSLGELTGFAGIGHCRYPTAGTDNCHEAQPLYVNSPFGIALAHNGNLTNADELRNELFRDDRRHLNTSSDSEVLLNVLAHELQIQDTHHLQADHIFKAVGGVHARCSGGYAVVAIIPGYGVLGFRDPHGIRPMVWGKRQTDHGLEYAIASESVALSVLGFELVADVAPGEAVYISMDGQIHHRSCAKPTRQTPCIFEYVYFARPDSLIDDISVYKARLRMGEKLAQKILRERPDHGIDVVIPVPDTARTSALPLAHMLGVKYREGLIKNRYIGRTFIMPGQEERARSVKRKLNPIGLEFRNKNVLLVDDSIVRGTTSRQIIQMAREAGARKVFFASAAPPVRHPNVYGIDMPAASELIAHDRDIAEIERELGADWLIYQELDDLIAACSEGTSRISEFDTSCFSGDYVTSVEADYLRQLELSRSDEAKSKTRVSLVG
ncbi:MAG: amidophosphoribosyltransferase [Lysobacteraceae bacterium]|nr:MAG: amidophosphoribosyltransferase [Xanthomonadaceae bacterium]